MARRLCTGTGEQPVTQEETMDGTSDCEFMERSDQTAAAAEEPPPATIFIVDDYVFVREGLRWLLEGYGFSVRTYASGAEFLADYDPGQPGCLVLDVIMPGMGGIALLDEMRVRGMALPVILMSGSRGPAAAPNATPPEVLDFLEKPFSDQVLLRRIRQALALDARRRRSAPKSQRPRRR